MKHKHLFIISALVAVMLSSCITNAIISTVTTDIKEKEVRAEGEQFAIVVSSAMTVTVTCSENWLSVDQTSFKPGLNGTSVNVKVERSTQNSVTTATIKFAIDSESFTEVKVSRLAYNDKIVYDIDGNQYKVLHMGKYDWMTSNLKSKHYDNLSEAYGREITETSYGDVMKGMVYFDGKNATNVNFGEMAAYKDRMGLLYNWCAAMGLTPEEAVTQVSGEYQNKKRQGICPNGFHMPTFDEATDLIRAHNTDFSIAGKKMKTTAGWNNDNNGDNTKGFSAYPCGHYWPMPRPFLKAVGSNAFFLCSTSYQTTDDPGTYKRSFRLGAIGEQSDDEAYTEVAKFETEAQSVRCVRNY